MPSYRAAFGKGVVIGAGVATAWAVARYYGRRQACTQLIDWDRATSVAIRACGAGGALEPDGKARLQEAHERLVRGIELPIADYTGTALPPGNTAVQVMDRADWIRANVSNFRALFAPVDELYAEAAQESPLGLPFLNEAGRIVVSTQAGLLIGYLARKVLGQYDISLLGKEPLTPGKLYFV